MGAILTQVQEGITRPIGYLNRQFRDSENRYNPNNAELTGIVASLNHFIQYLRSSTTTVFTDHLLLAKMVDRDRTTMDTLWVKIQDMDIKLIHIDGSKIPTDALSRQPRQPLAPSQIQKKHKRTSYTITWYPLPCRWRHFHKTCQANSGSSNKTRILYAKL